MGGRQILDFAGAIDSLGVPVGARGQDMEGMKAKAFLSSAPEARKPLN